jgi:ATP/maltotriose-dependent transcriptional regulator MalT
MDRIESIAIEAGSLQILETKCRPPLIPDDILVRPRFFQYLNHWQTRRLTIVQAPPGYGKTMQVSSWLNLLKKSTIPFNPRLLLNQGWIYLIADRLDTLAFLQLTHEN